MGQVQLKWSPMQRASSVSLAHRAITQSNWEKQVFKILLNHPSSWFQGKRSIAISSFEGCTTLLPLQKPERLLQVALSLTIGRVSRWRESPIPPDRAAMDLKPGCGPAKRWP